jgi:hypothetical protein
MIAKRGREKMSDIQAIIEEFPGLFHRFDIAFESESKRMEEALRDVFPDCRFKTVKEQHVLLIVHKESDKRLPLAVRAMEPFSANDAEIEFARQFRPIWLNR